MAPAPIVRSPKGKNDVLPRGNLECLRQSHDRFALPCPCPLKYSRILQATSSAHFDLLLREVALTTGPPIRCSMP